MKKLANRQKCELVESSTAAAESDMKCLTFMVFEEAGKTILQPLASSQEAQTIQQLFQNQTLEVWLPNGYSDLAQFDVNILKYKLLMQPPKECSKARARICLKNHFDTIVSCEQCPLSDYGVDE